MGWNMILRLFAVLLLFCPVTGMTATITAVTGGGHWSTTSTWVGGVLPDPLTDTVIIPSTLTAPVVLDDSRTIPATTVEDEVYGLVQGDSVITTLGGILTVGNGSGKDGKFTFGAGSTLSIGSNNLVLNNCILSSNATSVAWATITGNAAIAKGAVYASPKQAVVLSYIKFQSTGDIQFASGGMFGGAITNQIHTSHCTFNGQSTSNILFGQAGWTPGTTNVVVEYNDFRSVGHIFLHGLDVTTGSSIFRLNTVSNSTVKSIVAERTWSIVTDNVLVNCDIGATQVSTKGGHKYKNNFINLTSTNSIILQDSAAAQIVQNNYFYSTIENSHGVLSSGTGGSGTHDISGNVFETVHNTASGNYTYTSMLPVNVYENIMIGSGSLCNNLYSGTRSNYKCYNNTTYSTYNDNANGQLFISETNVSTGGSIDLYNNLVTGSVAIAIGVKNLTAGVQPLGKVGNNNFWNISTPYVGVGTGITIATDNTAEDLSVDPSFFDISRKLSTWGQAFAGADGTATDAIAKLLTMNGYDSVTKEQSNAPLLVGIHGAPTALVDWVRYGYSPTNQLLRTAGDGGTYIGAMDVVTLGNPAALLMVQ